MTLAPENDTCPVRFAEDNKRGKFESDVPDGPMSYAFFAQMSDHDAITLEEDDLPTLEEDDLPQLVQDSDDDDEDYSAATDWVPLAFDDVLTQNWLVDYGEG